MAKEVLDVMILVSAMKKLPTLSTIRFVNNDRSLGTLELISESFTVLKPGLHGDVMFSRLVYKLLYLLVASCK